MRHSTSFEGREAEIAALFTATFTASEGADEGAVVGALAADLMRDTLREDLCVCLADGPSGLAGAILFSRLRYAQDLRTVFVLSPVAVATGAQKQGVGQALLRYGLQEMRAQGVDVVLTYGDPNYYAKVGFRPISQDDIAAPYPLKYPHGWLGQSLTPTPLGTLAGPVTCVSAFADPALW